MSQLNILWDEGMKKEAQHQHARCDNSSTPPRNSPQLPRSQQQKITAPLEAVIAQHAQR
jgi:hypothetical protein